MQTYSYIFDFVSILFDKLEGKDKLRNVILFGSQARGDARKDSDIDIFIDVNQKDKESISNIVKEAINEFEVKAQKSWNLRGIKNSIVPIVDDLSDKRWSALKKEIAVYGIVLYGKYKLDSPKNKPHVLISYNISKLKQKEKMRLIRTIFGYKLKKGKKVYSQSGLLQNLKAEKLDGSILVRIEDYKPIYDFMRKSKVPLKIREVWID